MTVIKNRIYSRYLEDSGYREVLTLAIPLILGSGAMAVQQFVDRMFLAWYSPEAIAAAMPAGIVYFTLMSLFTGTAGYVSTFVAQYYGADQQNRIGAIIWQGMYLSVIAGTVLLFIFPFADSFFRMVGHDPLVQAYETVYFKLLCLSSAPVTVTAVLSGFYTGRGITVPVMLINFLSTGVNMLLNYILIFGKWGFPEWGVFGAGVATVIASCFTTIIFLLIVFRSRHERMYAVQSSWRFDVTLFLRLLRYALPNGIQFIIEHIGFSAFVLLVGRLGTTELAATNIAFNINMLAFMPMIGFGMAISILVGQNLGKDCPEMAERSVYSGLHLTFVYLFLMSCLYIFAPIVFIWPFSVGAAPGSLADVERMAIILLRFIAVYSLFDALTITFSSGIKGAGDTRFVMLMIIGFSIFGLTIPIYLALVILNLGLYAAWMIITVYIALLGLIFMFRFKGGKWKFMRVIETSQLEIA